MTNARSVAGLTANQRLPEPAAKLDEVGKIGDTTTYLNGLSARERASASSLP